MAVCLKTAAYALLPLLLPVPLPGNMLPLLQGLLSFQKHGQELCRTQWSTFQEVWFFPFSPASEHPGAKPLLWSSASLSMKSAPKVRLQGLEEDGNGRGWGKRSKGEVPLESSSVTPWETG